METGNEMAGRQRLRTLRALGWALLCAGLAAAVFGVLEIGTFKAFFEGGKFHYAGFGFGSFMYGVIALQTAGYFLMAAVFVLLGVGHIRARRWVPQVSGALLWTWLIVGWPVMIVALFLASDVKEFSLAGFLIFAVLSVAAILLLPFFMLRFYNSSNTQEALKANDTKPYRLEQAPRRVMALSFLCVFFAAEHLGVFLLGGIFPVFGVFLTDFAGYIANGLAMLALLFIARGLLRMRRGAYLGAAVLLPALLLSSAVTYCAHTYAGLLSVLAYPATETGFLQKMPLQGHHFALFTGLPLLAGCVAAALSGKYFAGKGKGADGAAS
ncbi:MAG: hypothetical protein ACYCX2_12050 [Christensenellales bacterium]